MKSELKEEEPDQSANCSRPCLTPCLNSDSSEPRPPNQSSMKVDLTHADPSAMTSGLEQNLPQNIHLNSYKFARPRLYIPNDYPASEKGMIDRLLTLSNQVGPKKRTPEYNDRQTRLLQLSKPKKLSKQKGTACAELNSVSAGSEIRMINIKVQNCTMSALVDTGSTNCLLSVETFQKLESRIYMPVKLNMKVAGHVLADNIVGVAIMPVLFQTDNGASILVSIDFLIAHATNGYDAIIGADFLFNDEQVSALTSGSIVLTKKFGYSSLPLTREKVSKEVNLMEICSPLTLPPFSQAPVTLALEEPIKNEEILTGFSSSFRSDPLNSVARSLESDNPHSAFRINTIKSVNSAAYSLSNFFLKEGGKEVSCILQNRLAEDLHFSKKNVVATLSKEEPTLSCNSSKASRPENDSMQEDLAESLDDEILQENMLIDTTNLDKVYTWKDCEINPSLDSELKAQLLEILEKHQTIFARNKLDVGKYSGFTVQLEIDTPIPAEKQRYLSEEKMAFCDKTFETFEKMG